MDKSVWIGWEPREADAFHVCLRSMLAHSDRPPEHRYAVDLEKLIRIGLYQRPTRLVEGKLWDDISGAPMSTSFSLSRFLVPALCRRIGQTQGLALFMDCDFLLRAPIDELFELADPRKAIQVVKHNYEVKQAIKMDGQANQPYPRKCWSSLIIFNMGHPALVELTVAKVNSWSGKALHQFEWLEDEFIGELPGHWNHLVGIDPPNPQAKAAHFTLGIPSMVGYESCEHSDEWRSYLGDRDNHIRVSRPEGSKDTLCRESRSASL